MRSAAGLWNVGFDLDGVLNDCCAATVGWLKRNGHCPADFPPDNVRTWRFEDSIPGLSGDAVLQAFQSGEPFRDAMPDIAGIRVVQALKHRGARIHIVTHRDQYPDAQKDTADWLAQWNVPYDHLVFAKAPDKVVYAEAAGLDIFVEDKRETAFAMADVCRISFLKDKPYNQSGVLPAKVCRFYSWTEVRRFFEVW